MRKKIYTCLLHLFTWVFFLSLPYILFFEDNSLVAVSMVKSPYYWLFSLSYGFLYYFNGYYLIPKFYLNKKYGLYAALVFLLFTIFYVLKPFFRMFRDYLTIRGGEMQLKPTNLFKVDVMTCILFVIFVSLGIALHVLKQWQVTERRALKAEGEKTTAELSFLKAQINPHFLFNTLNNIYSLSVDQHPETSASIMRLSNIMRYITDEATQDFVPLESEVSVIRNFIDLQKLRFSDNVKVKLEVTGDLEGRQIAPLILMTYIENAFKYGITSRENVLITIRISAGLGRISFFCQNKIFPAPRVVERTGIGQANTRQRLEYLYPEKHTLTITSENGFYTVALVVNA